MRFEMPKDWKYKAKANSKKNPVAKKCNNSDCDNYAVYDGCTIGRNFRNCNMYNVHPNRDLRK